MASELKAPSIAGAVVGNYVLNELLLCQHSRLEMLNFYPCAPFLAQILGNQTAMTVLRLVLTAQEAAAIEN